MTPLRRAVYDILATRDRKVANAWSRQFRPSMAGLPEHKELVEMNQYFFRSLSILNTNCNQALNCLVANGSIDHWLRDFANVVSPVVVNYSRELFGTGDTLERDISELGALIGVS